MRAYAELRGPGALGRAGCRRVGQAVGRGRRARVRGHAGPAAQHAGGLLAPRVARARARSRHDHASRREEQGVSLRACSQDHQQDQTHDLSSRPLRPGPAPSPRSTHRGLQTIPTSPHAGARPPARKRKLQYGNVTGKERKGKAVAGLSPLTGREASECN